MQPLCDDDAGLWPPSREALALRAWESTAASVERLFASRGVPASEREDLLHEVFARVLRDWERFEGGSLRSWVFTIAEYVVRGWRGQVRRESRLSPEPDLSLWPAPDAQDVAWGDVADALDRLEPLDQRLFELLFVLEMDVREVVIHLATVDGIELQDWAVRRRRRALVLALAPVLAPEREGQ